MPVHGVYFKSNDNLCRFTSQYKRMNTSTWYPVL